MQQQQEKKREEEEEKSEKDFVTVVSILLEPVLRCCITVETVFSAHASIENRYLDLSDEYCSINLYAPANEFRVKQNM